MKTSIRMKREAWVAKKEVKARVLKMAKMAKMTLLMPKKRKSYKFDYFINQSINQLKLN